MVGGAIATALGGWDKPVIALVVCMCADYITGLMVAVFFRKSPKTPTGGPASNVGFVGLCRKAAMILAVVVCNQLDNVAGTTFARNACAIGFVCNEAISLSENLGLMGINVPDAFFKVLSLATDKIKKGE